MKSFNKSFATVFTDGKHHKVMLPTGELVPHLIKTVTVDAIDFSKVEFELLCNVVETKEDALKSYGLTEVKAAK